MVLIAAGLISIASPAFSQTSERAPSYITGGVGLFLEFNNAVPDGADGKRGGVSLAPWVSAAFGIGPRVIVGVGAEFPTPYKRQYSLGGGAAQSGEIRHRDTIVEGIVGLAVRRPKSFTILSIGTGVAKTRTEGFERATGPRLPTTSQHEFSFSSDEFRPTLQAGVDFAIKPSGSSYLTFGVRGRFIWHPYDMEQTGISPFGLMPRIGALFTF